MADLENTHWWFVARRAIIVSTLARFVKERGLLLDIGLGTGANASVFQKLGFKVEGVEPEPEAIKIAQQTAPGVPVMQAPFPGAPLQEGRYGVAVMLDVLEHLEDDTAALREAARVLSPGGVLLITVPAFRFLWTRHDELAHHKRRYRRAELVERIGAAGLEPVFVSYYNYLLFPPIALVRLISKALGIQSRKSDFSKTPRLLNGVLYVMFSMERWLLRLGPLPFGVSLIAVARKL